MDDSQTQPWGEREAVKLSITTEKVSDLVSVDVEPMKRISGLSLFNLTTLEETKDSMSSIESVNEEGEGRLGLLVLLRWVSSA